MAVVLPAQGPPVRSIRVTLLSAYENLLLIFREGWNIASICVAIFFDIELFERARVQSFISSKEPRFFMCELVSGSSSEVLLPPSIFIISICTSAFKASLSWGLAFLAASCSAAAFSNCYAFSSACLATIYACKSAESCSYLMASFYLEIAE